MENSYEQLIDDYNNGILVEAGESITDYINRMGGVNYPDKKANGGIIKGCADFSGDARPKMAKGGSVSQQRKTEKIKTPKNISRGCGMVMPNRRKTFKIT